jgi:uncharacterized protein YnzC (UPF0291/DUF896 family)
MSVKQSSSISQHLNLLSDLNEVYKKSKDSKLTSETIVLMSDQLERISSSLEISTYSAIFFSSIASLSINGREADFSDLCRHFDLDPFELIPYMLHVEELLKKGYLVTKKPRRRSFENTAGKAYSLSNKMSDALIFHKPIPKLKQFHELSLIELLEQVNETIENCQNEELTFEELEESVQLQISTLDQFHFYTNCNLNTFCTIDQLVFLHLIWSSISGMRSLDVDSFLRSIHWKNSKRISYLQGFLHNKNELILSSLVERKPSSYMNDVEILLTDHSLSYLSNDGISVMKSIKERKDAIKPDNIAERELIYNSTEFKQVERIQKLLAESNYKLLKSRLKAESISSGVSILLHGSPGTGKTETAYQLARKTGRELIKIDMSATKSSWFGETEKIVKRIFTDYSTYATTLDRQPILLLNEADAILSVRRNVTSGSNAQQTENTIQNILLEEFENFEGILIATTNLANNFDRAFERRFLFKIKFEAPTKETQYKIWKNKLISRDHQDLESLTEEFNLSGGQIDNVFRKVKIEEMISGHVISYDQLRLFCKEEIMTSHAFRQIGFT